MYEELNSTITTNKTDEDFSFWVNKPYITPETRIRLLNSKILFLPFENTRRNNEPCLTIRAMQIASYLRSNILTPNDIGICIEENNNHAIDFFSAIEIIGTIMIQYTFAPLAVSAIYDFIKSKLCKQSKTTSINISLILTNIHGDEDKSVEITYEGPANDFNKVLDKISELK